jgi:hypothetical protein
MKSIIGATIGGIGGFFMLIGAFLEPEQWILIRSVPAYVVTALGLYGTYVSFLKSRKFGGSLMIIASLVGLPLFFPKTFAGEWAMPPGGWIRIDTSLMLIGEFIMLIGGLICLIEWFITERNKKE